MAIKNGCGWLCAAVTVGAVSAPALAGDPPALSIATERPGFGDTTGIMQTMHLNIETGYTFTHRDRDGVTVDRHNGPEVLVRFGLMDDRLEVRAVWSGYVHTRTDAGVGGISSANGFSDPALGFKFKLADQGEWAYWTPRLVFEALTTLGSGGDEVSSQRAEPTVKLLMSYDLGVCCGESMKGWTVTSNLNVAWTNSAGEHFTQFQGSIGVSFPTFQNCSGFAEYYVLGPNSKGTDAAHYVDFGGAWLVCPRLQLDARVGFGLNHEADNVFFGVGASVLF